MNQNREKLISKICQLVPPKIGIYIFTNENNHVIYIGKSVNLRNRMLSYFRQKPNRFEIRINQMVHNIFDFSFQTTESEFLALLQEDSLIKKYHPFFNIRQREFDEYQYLRLTNNTFPTLKLIDHLANFDGGGWFGPFKDKYFAETILTIIHNYLHLRLCKEPEPKNRCLSFELGSCLGPCRDKISQQDYGEIVNQTVEFLEGHTKNVIQILKTEMAQNAASLDFEKASVQKEQITVCLKFAKRQKFFNLFKTKNLVIVEKNADVTYYFNKGILTSHSIDLNHSSDDRFVLDRANIVYQWIHNKKNGCEYYFE